MRKRGWLFIVVWVVLASALLGSVFWVGLARAQSAEPYATVPNFTGPNAGQQFRGAINDKLSGTSVIAPRIAQVACASLPSNPAKDGQEYWGYDCQAVDPCTGGGTGALAISKGGAWKCAAGGSGSSFPLSGDVSAATHKIQNLAPATASGDAVGYAMTGPQFTAYQQTLFANAPPTFNYNQNLGGPTVSVEPPTGITNGHVLLELVGGNKGASFVYSSGFTELRHDDTTSNRLGVACKIASNESGNYSITGGTGAVGAVVMYVPELTSCTLDTSNVGTGTGSATVQPFAASQNDVIITNTLALDGCNNTTTTPGVQGFGACSVYFVGSPTYFSNPTTTTPVVTASGTASYAIAVQVLAFHSPAGTVQDTPLVTGQSGGMLASLDASLNNVINVQSSPYNARGDGNTDDWSAIQTAIYDACGATPPTAPPNLPHREVYLPKSSVCYMHSKPIRIPCKELKFGGAKGTQLCQDYVGSAIIQNGWGTGKLTYGSALVGTGNSLATPSGQLSESIDLARVLDAPGNNNLNSQISNGLNISFYMKPTSTADGEVFESQPAYPGSGDGAFKFSRTSTQGACRVNTVTGGELLVGTCPAQTTNTVYEIELDWNGSTYRCWQGTVGDTATLCGSSTSSNKITQGVYEEILLPSGGAHQYWPDGSSTVMDSFVGYLDSVRIEKASVHAAAYTVPNTKATADGSTLLLENFEDSLDGTQIATIGSVGGWLNTRTAYHTVLDLNPTISITQGDYIHDLELCGNGARSGYSDGLFASAANNANWVDLSCSNAYFLQGEFFNNDYLSRVMSWRGYGGHVGLVFNSAWNDSIDMDTQVDGTDVACGVYQGGGGGDHEVYHARCTDRGNLRYGWIENNSQATYYYPFIDQEAGNSVFVTSFLLNQPAQPYVFISGNIDTRNSAPYIIDHNAGYGSIFQGFTFNNFGQSTPASYVVDYTGTGTPNSATHIIDSWIPSDVPLSNHPEWLFQPGQYYTSSTVSVSGTTNLTLPLLGDAIIPITMNASAQLNLPAAKVVSQNVELDICYSGAYTPTIAGASGVTIKATYPTGWPTATNAKCDICNFKYDSLTTARLTGCALNQPQ